MKTSEIVEKLFGSSARVRIMRFFLSNQEESAAQKDLTKRLQLKDTDVRRELSLLEKAGFIKAKTSQTKRGGKQWRLNKTFPLIEEFESLVSHSSEISGQELLECLKKAGTVKLLVLSGVFTNAVESTTDVLIVFSKLQNAQTKKAVAEFEAWFGKEIRYAAFSQKDFLYRRGFSDRLLRDVFDHHHEIVLDRGGLLKQ